MISGAIQGSHMKLCTVIVLFKTYHNTKRNFENLINDVTMASLLKTTGKFGPPETMQMVTNHLKGNDKSFPKM